MKIDYSTPADSFAMAQVGSGKLGLSGLSAGYTELTLSTYTSLALLKAAIDAIAGNYFAATVESEDSPLALKPMTADMLLSPCYLEGPDDTIGAASVDEDAAIIDLGCRHSGWVYVQYKAGYAAIPEGLAQIATEIAADILDSSKLNSNLQSERIGDYQYTVSTSTEQAVLSRYADRLAPYRRFRL
jgi:hypothetical protein